MNELSNGSKNGLLQRKEGRKEGGEGGKRTKGEWRGEKGKGRKKKILLRILV